MTVRELIAALSRCPDQEMKVYVEGNETGDFPIVGVGPVERLRFSQGIQAVRLEAGESDYDGDDEADTMENP